MNDQASSSSSPDRLLARFGRAFAAGDVLFREGERGGQAFLLHEGRVRLVKRAGGRERSIRLLLPGDMFGEAALLDDHEHTTTAIALENGSLLALEAKTFDQIITSHPVVGVRLLRQLIRRVRDAEDRIELLMLNDPRSKVVLALLKGLPSRPVDNRAATLSPTELAARAGLELSEARMAVTELATGGYVEYVEDGIAVPSRERLAELLSLFELRDLIRGDAPRSP